MTVSCQLTNGDMAEAFRLNTTPATWSNLALRNGRLVAYLIVLVVIIAIRLRNPGHVAATQGIAALTGLVALFVALLAVRMYNTLRRRRAVANASCATFVFDSGGVTVESREGRRETTPWSSIHRWREGKTVFTMGDAKNFYTVPKRALGEMQSGELRSLLMAHVR